MARDADSNRKVCPTEILSFSKERTNSSSASTALLSCPLMISGPRIQNHAVSAAIVCIAVLISFRAAPFLDFVDYDDSVLLEFPQLTGGISMDAVRFAFTQSPTNLWNPLTFLSHALDFQIFGKWAGGHHITNVLLHLGTALLLLYWLRRFTENAALALCITLLFAIHPLRVESVVWISERKDVLSAFFYLLTVTFYSIWAKSDNPRRRFYIFAVVSACLGLLSKPSLMTLPAALLLIDFWPLQRLDLKSQETFALLRKRLIEKVPFLLIALTAAAVAWFTWSGNQFIGEPPNLSLLQRAGFASLAYTSYLWRTFFPFELAAFYTYPAQINYPAMGAAAVFLIAISVLVWRLRENSPWLLFGWFWFIGLIVPASGLITISDHFAPDRYTHLAHIGLFTAIVLEISARFRTLNAAPLAGWIALGAVLAVFSFRTSQQSQTWKNAESLWRHAIAVTGQNYVAHNQLGLALLESGRFEEGVAELKNSNKANPKVPLALGNLSMAYAKQGQFEDALAWFKKAGEGLPDRDRYRKELAAACLATGNADLAEKLWENGIKESPDDPDVHLEAADFFYQQGDSEKALTHYHRAAELGSKNIRATQSVGAILLKRRKVEEALPFLERSVSMKAPPAEAASARRTLAQAYLLQRNWAASLQQYSEAVSLAPEQHVAVNELAQLLLQCPEKSLQNPSRALQLATTLPVQNLAEGEVPNPRYLITLATAHSRTGNSGRAGKVAAAGLKVLDIISQKEPLPDPWTTEEIESLRKRFQQVIPAAQE